MAQKRMLDKKISVSEQVNRLSDRAALVFTWGIAHADDLGFLPFSIEGLKHTIIPMRLRGGREFSAAWAEIVACKDHSTNTVLIQLVEIDGQKYWHYPMFEYSQTVKKDRVPNTLLDLKDAPVAKAWADVEKKLSGMKILDPFKEVAELAVENPEIQKPIFGMKLRTKGKKNKHSGAEFTAAKDHLIKTWKLKSGEYPFTTIDAGLMSRLLTRGLPMTLALLDLFWIEINSDREKWTRDSLGKTLKALFHILPKLLDDYRLKGMAEKHLGPVNRNMADLLSGIKMEAK